MLGAWVPAPQKSGRPQMSCKDNFIHFLKSVPKDQISNDATFKEWFPIAVNETLWNSLIKTHFQKLCTDDTVHEYVPYDSFSEDSEGEPWPLPMSIECMHQKEKLEITETFKKLRASDSVIRINI